MRQTATGGAGGVRPVGTVVFAANQATATISIGVAGDTAAEADEAFTVTLSSPAGAILGQPSASATILNDDVPALMRTIGEAGPYSRSNPDAARNALKFGVSILHRQDGGNPNEAWRAANFGTSQPGAYGGSDLVDGALGVAGRTTGTQTTPQELDGTEALRFVFASPVSSLGFGFGRFDAGDRAVIEAYDAAGTLVRSQSASTAVAGLDGMNGVASVVLRAGQGSFAVDRLSFG